jgi:hypothetical protein
MQWSHISNVSLTVGTLLRGARLVIMQQSMNGIPLNDEVDILYEHLRSDKMKGYLNCLRNDNALMNRSIVFNHDSNAVMNIQNVSDAKKANRSFANVAMDSLVSHYYDESYTKNDLSKLIYDARKNENDIIKSLESMHKDDDRNKFLMQRFCVHILSGEYALSILSSVYALRNHWMRLTGMMFISQGFRYSFILVMFRLSETGRG